MRISVLLLTLLDLTVVLSPLLVLICGGETRIDLAIKPGGSIVEEITLRTRPISIFDVERVILSSL